MYITYYVLIVDWDGAYSVKLFNTREKRNAALEGARMLQDMDNSCISVNTTEITYTHKDLAELCLLHNPDVPKEVVRED